MYHKSFIRIQHIKKTKISIFLFLSSSSPSIYTCNNCQHLQIAVITFISGSFHISCILFLHGIRAGTTSYKKFLLITKKKVRKHAKKQYSNNNYNHISIFISFISIFICNVARHRQSISHRSK